MANISAKNKIDSFIKELSARKPSPGGGAAAALAGALGAALIVKVANFTRGKEAKAIAKRAGALRNRLSAHIEKDARAYGEYAKTGLAASMKKASRCASEISKLSMQGVRICARLKKVGNRNLKGDIMAAESLLRASAKAAGGLVNDG